MAAGGEASFASYYFHFTPPRVTDPFSIDYKRCEAWIDAHPPIWKDNARHVISSIEEISFEAFLTALKESISSYEKFLDSLEEKLRKFVIVIPDYEQDPSRGDSPPHLKSNLFVSRWAMQFFSKEPEHVVFAGKEDADTILEEYSGMRHLILDDAAYSGEQTAEALKFVPKADLIIPYMTNRAKDNFVNEAGFIARSKTMKSIKELGIHSFPCMPPLDFRHDNLRGRVLTIFHHKMGDFLSLEQGILEGFTLAGKKMPRLYTKGIVPYKTEKTGDPIPKHELPHFLKTDT